jgi:hypothetical protein
VIYSRNAGEFRDAFWKIREEFRKRHERRLQHIAAVYAREEAEANRRILEHGLRVYLLDGFLDTLNWNLFGGDFTGPTLFPEVSVESLQTRTVRRMDYLGVQCDTERPLLNIEAKRPSPLPRGVDWNGGAPSNAIKQDFVEKVSRAMVHVRSNRPQDSDIGSDWWDSLATLRDYARSVHARVGSAPRRSAMSDGNWLLIFTDPQRSFVEDDPDAALLQVFFLDYLDTDFADVFNLLEYQRVLGDTGSLSPAQVPFHVKAEQIGHALHGVRILRTRKPSIFRAAPQILVQPLLFLRTLAGGWFTIEDRTEFTLPADHATLPQHLEEVQSKAAALLDEVGQRLGMNLTVGTLEDHYANGTDFAALPGVRRERAGEEQQYLVVTGRASHYLQLYPTVENCPYHEWLPDTGTLSKIHVSTITPPAHFPAGADHHCAHRDVSDIKAGQITDQNLASIGPRSPSSGGAFCEIWTFEQFLCCRTCVFQTVCSQSTVFHLPCRSAVVQDR